MRSSTGSSTSMSSTAPGVEVSTPREDLATLATPSVPLAGSPVFYAALLLCASYWRPRIFLRRFRPGKPLVRPVLLSPLLCKLVISQERFLWKALDGPKDQHAMIEGNCRTAAAAAYETRSRAVWHYMIDTLDPLAQQTHIGRDNLYYHARLVGRAIPSISPLGSIPCSPNRASWTISTLTPMEIAEVLARFSLATLTIAALMDSMD
ncbi:hypothetical protein BDW75DRAFT_242358 [Aspergillus navahoensis]